MVLSRKDILVFASIFFVFIVLHLPAVHFPYHQDEYKWVYYSHPELTPPGTIPHPPLTEFIYTKIGPIVGDNNFRFIPFFFGLANFFLLFYLVKTVFDKKTAFWSVGLFTISFYSLLATLMVDVDGAIMPFFFLLMTIGYFKWKQSTPDSASWKYLILLIIGAIGGFLIKVSAILPILAIFLDFLIEKEVFKDKKKIFKYFLYALGGGVVLVLVLLLAKFIFPFFNLKYSIGYWAHFADSSSFLDRGWLQTFIEFFKSILYTSPLLILPAIFANKEIFKKTRVFYFFIFFGLIFYIVAFDFSIGALDRYFQFLVIPLCIISGAIFSRILDRSEIKTKFILSISILTIFLFCLQLLPHTVPALHPKAEWLNRIFSFKWNFLYPFSGGSGPLGFYISFLFLGLVWIITGVTTGLALLKNNYRKLAIVLVFIFGLTYNIAFIEEYLFGRINGSAPKVLAGAVDFIKNNPNIKSVTVYNDNGGYDIKNIGKYDKRLYTDPKFGTEEKMSTLNQNKEYYLEVNIPRIDPNSFYRQFLDSCNIVYKQTDRSISAIVYDCTKAPDIK